MNERMNEWVHVGACLPASLASVACLKALSKQEPEDPHLRGSPLPSRPGRRGFRLEVGGSPRGEQ